VELSGNPPNPLRFESSENAALLVIDVQKGFDDSFWGARNNPQAEANIAAIDALLQSNP
jgi:nicotinamidase-related amidase